MRRLNGERGHVGVTVGSLLALAGTVVLAIGLGGDNNIASVIGAIALGAGSLLGMNAPHIWMRSVYRRLDKVDPEDHEAMPEKRIRIQF